MTAFNAKDRKSLLKEKKELKTKLLKQYTISSPFSFTRHLYSIKINEDYKILLLCRLLDEKKTRISNHNDYTELKRNKYIYSIVQKCLKLNAIRN